MMKRYAVSVNNHTSPVIKAGKRYEVFDWDMDEDDLEHIAFFNIQTVNDDGTPFEANCIAFQPCAFLEYEQWTITEEAEPSNDH